MAEVAKSGVKRSEREYRRGSSCVPGKPLPGFGGDVAFSTRRRERYSTVAPEAVG